MFYNIILCLREGYSMMFSPVYFFKNNIDLLSQRENYKLFELKTFYMLVNAELYQFMSCHIFLNMGRASKFLRKSSKS